GGVGVKTDFAAGNGPIAVAVGDFNGDGEPDLATANEGASTVSALLNACGSAILTVTPSGVRRGQELTASWDGIPSPTATDWLGLYQAGAPDSSILAW